jgi:hypothetical protein
LIPSQDQVQLFKLAFDHYIKHLDKLFDLLEALFSIRPQPNNLTNNLVRLLKFARSCVDERESADGYLSRVAPILATTITLDAARSYQINARLSYIFKGNMSGATNSAGLPTPASANSYQSNQTQLPLAVETYCLQSVPCSFVDKFGHKCVNSKRRHWLPFHQRSTGLPIAFGAFQSEEIEQMLQLWLPAVESEIEALEIDLAADIGAGNSSTNTSASSQSKLDAVWRCHLRGNA